MKKIENPSEISFSKIGMENVIVLLHSEVLKPKWLTELIPGLGYDETITLDAIKNQFPYNGLMVIVERPLSGEIYRFGNYDDTTWHQVGTMDGYA